MIKFIMTKLGYKVFTREDYERLTDRIADCSIIYRKHADSVSYHHSEVDVKVKASDLSTICLVENCIWDDVKDKIYKGVSE